MILAKVSYLQLNSNLKRWEPEHPLFLLSHFEKRPKQVDSHRQPDELLQKINLFLAKEMLIRRRQNRGKQNGSKLNFFSATCLLCFLRHIGSVTYHINKSHCFQALCDKTQNLNKIKSNFCLISIFLMPNPRHFFRCLTFLVFSLDIIQGWYHWCPVCVSVSVGRQGEYPSRLVLSNTTQCGTHTFLLLWANKKTSISVCANTLNQPVVLGTQLYTVYDENKLWVSKSVRVYK